MSKDAKENYTILLTLALGAFAVFLWVGLLVLFVSMLTTTGEYLYYHYDCWLWSDTPQEKVACEKVIYE